MPEKLLVQSFVETLYSALFLTSSPCSEDFSFIDQGLTDSRSDLDKLILKTDDTDSASEFYNQILELYSRLMRDAQTIYFNDPAARSLEMVLYSSSGFLLLQLIVLRINYGNKMNIC